MTSNKLGFNHLGVTRVLRLIRKRACRPIAVAHLIKASGMSRRGLHKAFVKHTGKGPGCVLREFRMMLAQQLLRDSRIPIEKVSFRSGYQLLNSFYVAFRRHTGVSPAAFRDAAFCMDRARAYKPRAIRLNCSGKAEVSNRAAKE